MGANPIGAIAQSFNGRIVGFGPIDVGFDSHLGKMGYVKIPRVGRSRGMMNQTESAPGRRQ